MDHTYMIRQIAKNGLCDCRPKWKSFKTCSMLITAPRQVEPPGAMYFFTYYIFHSNPMSNSLT